MNPNHRRAELVQVNHLESEFLAQFTTAEPAPSHLMRDVDVIWTKAPCDSHIVRNCDVFGKLDESQVWEIDGGSLPPPTTSVWLSSTVNSSMS